MIYRLNKKMMMKWFNVDELCRSNTASRLKINNTPSKEITEHLKELIEFLDNLRDKWGSAIKVTSGYRCPELNEAVGGSKTSAHLTGYAADIVPVNADFKTFWNFVVEYLQDKRFDQCINEHNRWIHLGLYNNAGKQRKQIFGL